MLCAAMKLTVLSSRGPETQRCTYCPKLCRPACPVSSVEGSETVTPWGKMRAAGEILRDVVPLDADHASPLFACSGCRACFELCDLGNPVADTLVDARADALLRGAAPAAVAEFVRTFERREEKLGVAASALPRMSGRVAFLPGCTSVVFEPGTVVAAARAVARLDAPAEIVADVCCGLPLLDAGDREGFLRRARHLSERLFGFARAVVSDPGCAHALRVTYPRLGFSLPAVRHFSEVAAASLGVLETLRRPPAPVAYHDACRLGRGLDIYDAPRAVLTRVLGAAPLELRDRRERGACSGAGGLLAKSRPATALAMAGWVGAQMPESGATMIVTTCPSSRRQFSAAGIPTLDFTEVVSGALGGRS